MRGSGEMWATSSLLHVPHTRGVLFTCCETSEIRSSVFVVVAVVDYNATSADGSGNKRFPLRTVFIHLPPATSSVYLAQNKRTKLHAPNGMGSSRVKQLHSGNLPPSLTHSLARFAVSTNELSVLISKNILAVFLRSKISFEITSLHQSRDLGAWCPVRSRSKYYLEKSGNESGRKIARRTSQIPVREKSSQTTGTLGKSPKLQPEDENHGSMRFGNDDHATVSTEKRTA